MDNTSPSRPVATPALPAWRPKETGDVSDSSRARTVCRIEGRREKSMDIVTRLKEAAIGRFYASHLKQLPFVRGVVVWLWRNVYPIYVNHISIVLKNRKTKHWQSLIKLCDYTRSRGLTTIQLVSAVVVETPPPKVFPESDQVYLESPHDRYNAPAIYVATIREGLIYGGTNLILTKDCVICHDLYDFERDFTSEELHGRTLTDAKSSRIRWMLHDELPERLPAAAAFVDSCAANYAHWLTEVLPRIAAFCADEQFNGIPIVVNDGLHKNIMESLFLVAGSEREIITLTIGRALAVDKLYLTSVAGYVPFERRTNKISDHSHGIFCPQAFDLIRNQVTTFLEKLPDQDWPEKIYLRRTSGVRKVTNTAALEELLVAHGYVIVEPEKLTFLRQAQLFSHAKVVIGSTGAALANMIFCPSTTEIYIFISKHPDTSYWYWQNIAAASGKHVRYFFGDVRGESSRGIHDDFFISTDEVLISLLSRSKF